MPRRSWKIEIRPGIPDIFRKAILDELLVLVLVETHEDRVVSGLRTSFEVENHGRFYEVEER